MIELSMVRAWKRHRQAGLRHQPFSCNPL